MTLAADLAAIARGHLAEGEPLAPRSTIRLGGAAELWFEPAGEDDLVAALRLCAERGVRTHVVGGGANTLISDQGLEGLVIHLRPSFGGEAVWLSDDEVELGAGLTGMKAFQAARSRGFAGAEFLVGIPGTLGGQVAMNAGTSKGQVSDLLTGVRIAEPSGTRLLTPADLKQSYRHTELPAGAVVTRLRLKFKKGDLRAADVQLREDLDYRRRTQPWQKPNLGSTFRNPPGNFAGALIEKAGLKGFQVGQVAFSPLHANFLTNLGGGRAAEALELIQTARERVVRGSGISLVLEVRLAGAL